MTEMPDISPWPTTAPDDTGADHLGAQVDGVAPFDPAGGEEAARQERERVERERVAERKRRAIEIERIIREARRVVNAEEQAAQLEARRLRLLDGWAFLAEEEITETAIWGDGDAWAWAPGEPLMLFGGNGVYKSTLSHLLVFARLGLIGPDGCPRADHEEVTAESAPELWGRVLGMPVRPVDGNVFYLAGDRPKQIKRAMRRLRREWMREVLHDRLIVHEGPLPFEITDSKDALADLVEQHKGADVVLDSLKDYCGKPSDDETANGYNRARQECVARGVQWVEDHHNRKQAQGQPKTNGIEDVYGSRWLSAGAGSILVLSTDEEGSATVQVRQLKSPAEFIKPLIVTVDKRAGTMSAGVRPDPVTFVRGAGVDGITVAEYMAYSGQSQNAARNWLNTRVKGGQFEQAPQRPDGLNRYRTVLGVVAQAPQNVWQQDGLEGV